jgi:hypothetical protein
MRRRSEEYGVRQGAARGHPHGPIKKAASGSVGRRTETLGEKHVMTLKNPNPAFLRACRRSGLTEYPCAKAPADSARGNSIFSLVVGPARQSLGRRSRAAGPHARSRELQVRTVGRDTFSRSSTSACGKPLSNSRPPCDHRRRTSASPVYSRFIDSTIVQTSRGQRKCRTLDCQLLKDQ